MVELTIDGKKVQVAEGTTILEAAKQASVNIPHLCYVEGVSPDGACGICVVSVKGERSFTRSCARQAANGMDVTTNSPEIRNIRKTIIELLFLRTLARVIQNPILKNLRIAANGVIIEQVFQKP